MSNQLSFKHGGKRQRLAALSSTDTINHCSDPLFGDPEVDVLLELWSLGLLTATMLVAIAEGAMKVAPREQMRILADLGFDNSHRNLVNKLNMESNPIPRTLVSLPLKDSRPRGLPRSSFKDYPFQLPHAFIAGMYEHFPAVFNHFIKGLRPLSEFWDSVRSTDPRLLCHPMQSTPQYKNKAVPMRIHVDAVPIGRGKIHQ